MNVVVCGILGIILKGIESICQCGSFFFNLKPGKNQVTILDLSRLMIIGMCFNHVGLIFTLSCHLILTCIFGSLVLW